MAGHSPSKTGVNALMSRPSTSYLLKCSKDVDARHKAGHDTVERPRFARPGRTSLIQLFIPSENAALVERNAPVRSKISRDVFALRDAIADADETRRLALDALDCIRKRIAQTFDQLKHRQIGVREFAPEQPGTAAARQHGFKIAEIFRRPLV